MPRQIDSRSNYRTNTKKLLHIAGLPAVSALFSTAPERVQRLYFDQRTKPHAEALCAELARVRKPYRLVKTDELARIAGSSLHDASSRLHYRDRCEVSILLE